MRVRDRAWRTTTRMVLMQTRPTTGSSTLRHSFSATLEASRHGRSSCVWRTEPASRGAGVLVLSVEC